MDRTETLNKPRLCVDCAFREAGRCGHPSNRYTDLETGETRGNLCGYSRTSFGLCGPDGKLYQPRAVA